MTFETGRLGGVVAKCHAGSCGASLPTMLEELDATSVDRTLIIGGAPEFERLEKDGEYVHHVYHDEGGNPVARKVRGMCGGMTAKRPNGTKDISWEYFDAARDRWLTRTAWNKAHKSVPPPKPELYHLPGVLKAAQDARPVYVAEGEACADALERIGCAPATTNPHGAGKWSATDSDRLVGSSSAAVFEDDDETGRSHVATVACLTHRVRVPDVRIVRFERQRRPDGRVGGGDVADWIAEQERAGKIPEQIRAALLARVKASPRWTPPEPAESASTELPRFIDVERLRRASVTAAEFVALEIPQGEPLLGDHVLERGELGVIVAKPGKKKTWLMLQMGIAMVRAVDFMGLSTHSGCNVGFLSLELSDKQLQRRIRTLAAGDPAGLDRLYVIGKKKLGGIVDLNPEAKECDLAGLRAWIEEPLPGASKLDVVVIDALSRASSLPEADLRPLLRALDELCLRTGCSVFLIHHERKSDSRDAGRGDDLDAFRGDSALTSFSTLCIRVTETAGVGVIRFAKVTNGPTPEPIYFKLREDGTPELAEAPSVNARDKGDKTTQAVLAAVQAAGPHGITHPDLEKAVSRTRNTVDAHLGRIGDAVRKEGSGKATRWVHSSFPRSQSAQSAQSAQSTFDCAEEIAVQQ